MKTLVVTGLIVMSSFSWAARLEVSGEGVQTMTAEYLKLSVTVSSVCHTSALDSRSLVDQKVALVQQSLQPFLDASIGDQIQVSPGNNSQNVISVYDRKTDITTIICDEVHSWQSNSTLSFKLTRLQDLAQLQDALFTLAKNNNIPNGVNTVGITLDVSTPQPGVLAATWDAMVDNALRMAYNDALRQVNAIAKITDPNPQIKLLKMTGPSSSNSSSVYDRVTGSSDSSGTTLGKVSLKTARLFLFEVK